MTYSQKILQDAEPIGNLKMERAFKTLAAIHECPVPECGEGLVSFPDGMRAEDLTVEFSQTKIANSFERFFDIRQSLLPDVVSIARVMNDRG